MNKKGSYSSRPLPSLPNPSIPLPFSLPPYPPLDACYAGYGTMLFISSELTKVNTEIDLCNLKVLACSEGLLFSPGAQ